MTHAFAAARRLSIIALAAALSMLSACTAISPAPTEAPPPTANIDVASLTRAMAARDRALETLQTSAIMDYSSGADHVKAREQFVVRRPESLRVEAMSPFGVALIVAAQDSRLQIFEPSKNTLMHGTADAATLARFARIPMAPRDAVGLLMGIVPDAQNSAPPTSVATEGDMTLLLYDDPNHWRGELGFHEGQLAMVRKRNASGAVEFEIRYSDYHDAGGVTFPYHIDADFMLVQTRVSITYKAPVVNGKISDSVFTLIPSPNAKQIDLGMILIKKLSPNG